MEFSKADRVKFKSILMQTYKFFCEFCYDNKIEFCAAGGTMIGAVRNHSLIPWDDDIDVYMKRSDYDKFIACRTKLKDTEYEIIDQNIDGYYCAHAKFSHRNSTIWEFESIPFMLGAFIDIFVLDYDHGKWEKIVKKRMDFAHLVNRLYICSNNHLFLEITNLFLKGNFRKAIWYLFLKLLFFAYRPLLKNQVLGRTFEKSGEWLVAYTGTSEERDIFRSEWFDSYISVEFEDTYINVPSGYDSLLTAMYGDYMTPPPIEERLSHHVIFYYNLDRRISNEEIKKIQVG